MSEDAFIHNVHVAVFGIEVWPLTWPVIFGLLAVALVVVATTAALMWRSHDSAQD